jgi:hypothetical protein
LFVYINSPLGLLTCVVAPLRELLLVVPEQGLGVEERLLSPGGLELSESHLEEGHLRRAFRHEPVERLGQVGGDRLGFGVGDVRLTDGGRLSASAAAGNL